MRLCIIPGDGIGNEVTDAARHILESLPLPITYKEVEAGWKTFQKTGHALPEATLQAAQEADAVLFGAVASPSHPVEGYRSPIVALRKALDLYANIRPMVGLPTADGQSSDIDLVVVRENTEGLYVGRERLEDDGNTAIAERVITKRSSERIVRTACELAQKRAAITTSMATSGDATPRRPKLTIVHKANVLRVTDGLFRQTALAVTERSPDIEVEELLVDTAAMHLAQSPQRFDVVVSTNMFGDILSDVACIHGGGLGLASSANLGDSAALFEPVHGAAPDIAGQGVANPLAMFGCVAMLLEWSEPRMKGSKQWALRLRAGLQHILRHGPHTPDMGGTATTTDVTHALQALLSS